MAADPDDNRIRSIAIVGGGTAGWIAASALARALGGSGCRIQLVESEEIGTVGVGEATIPPLIDFLSFLDIDEQEFRRFTQATFKLGVRFYGWRRPDLDYWHPFGQFGAVINRRPFHHFWLKARAEGLDLKIDDVNAAAALGDAGRFSFPGAGGAAAGLRYALHFDASRVAQYLRLYAEHLGVERIEGRVEAVTLDDRGFIDDLGLADGRRIKADLYIDCSGFRGLLIEGALKTGYLDWTAMLPCDRAVAAPSAAVADPAPFTAAIAGSAGWRWRIPLRNRVGNGYVYSSAFTSDADAHAELEAALGPSIAAEPRLLRFVTGRRKAFWNKNCVALGLASGFLEPIESTSIQLMINGVYNLIDHFPDRGFDPANIASFNRQLIDEFDTVRDFIIAHYVLTERRDTPFWRHCAEVPVPDSLAERFELYRATGRIDVGPRDLFTAPSWFYVFDGMGLRPKRYDPLCDVPDFAKVRAAIEQVSGDIRRLVAASPTHAEALARD